MNLRNLNSSIIHRIVFELRYDYGFTYLDRYGAILNGLLPDNPGWYANEINPQSGSIHNPDYGLTYNFNIKSVSLEQGLSEKIHKLLGFVDFSKIAKNITSVVVDRLGIEQYNRIGFRVWRLFECENLDDARIMVRKLGFVSTEKIDKLNVGELEEVSINFIVKHDFCNARIAITPAVQDVRIDPGTLKQVKESVYKLPSEKRKDALLNKIRAKKAIDVFPLYSMLIDIDNYIEYPPDTEDLSIEEFIINSDQWSDSFLEKLSKGD